MSDHPHPLGSLGLFGLADRRLDLVLTVLLIAAVLASRIIAFPASIWEQDEAAFAAAILDFDGTDNRPHPPWFPLWIGMGKLVHLAGLDPARALQLISLVFSVWMIFPLTAMWLPVVGRRSAVGGAVLYLVAPGPWFFAGRAFCGTTATALLTAALAFWLQAEDRPRWFAAGSLAAALSVLVRPQLLPSALGAMLLVALRTKTKTRDRLLLVAPFATVLGIGAGGLIVATGGIESLETAIRAHASYHLPGLDLVDHGFAGSGFSRSLGHPAVAVVWLVLAAAGLFRLTRRGRLRAVTPIVLGALLPLLVVVYGFSNPAHARYAVPLLVLTCGLVALGVEGMMRRWTRVAIGAAVIFAIAVVAPQLAAYRSAISPPSAALEEALIEAKLRRGVVVVDRTLLAFVTLRRLERPTGAPILFDHMIELGHVPPPPPEKTVFVFDAGHGGLLIAAENQKRFTCSIPLVEMLAQDRFLNLTVTSGATLRGSADASGPLILID